MTATTPHIASAPGQADDLLELATRLYARVSSGHDGLAYNVDAHGAALTVVDADGKRRPVVPPTLGAPAWQRARELRQGVEADRRLNPWVLQQHLRGRYSIAPAAPGWVEWVALDIDAHPAPGARELAARRLAKERADRVLAGVWRALGCTAERHPLVLRSPGGGYHVWFPLTRGATSANPEHTWPAAVARAWFERHLVAAGLELGPGALEVFPSGRCLRAPCGRGMVMLQATQPGEPDALGLVPWPGTMANSRVDWRGERSELSMPVRRVVPMVQTFIAQWEAQRRTLTEWLGRPEASWDPAWGFLGWRDVDETLAAEKKSVAVSAEKASSSQESDDVLGRLQAGRVLAASVGEGRGRVRRERGRSGVALGAKENLSPSAPQIDASPDSAGDPLVRGRAFREKVRRLLAEGITEPSTRHDAVLTLAFYWGATCGLGEVGALSRLEAWCAAYAHVGSRLSSRPRVFRDTCMREARHYLTHYAARWRFQGRGDGGGLASLTSADQAVLAAADPRVRGEVSAILAWLAGRAAGDGRIGDPVQIATGLLARLCGDRRVDEDGKRRRTTTIALAELERLGVLTLAHDYRVGQRGRVWSCWYRFGSGELPRTVELPTAEWKALEQPVAAVPTLAIVAQPEPLQAAASAPIVVVRVVGERVVPEGLLRVLSDGARGVPRTLLTLAPDVARPTVAPSSRAPWFVRVFEEHAFTPAELWTANVATVIPFADIASRRRMSRRQRLACGGSALAILRGGGTSVIPLRADCGQPAASPIVPCTSPLPDRPVWVDPRESSAPFAPPHPDVPVRVVQGDPSPPCTPPLSDASVDRVAPVAVSGRAAEELWAELAAEVGRDATAALPIDLVDVVAHAWRGFRRSRGP